MILHQDEAPYRDRDAAALSIVDLLKDLKGRRAVVLGIPGGGVPMARVIASSLDGELDLAMATGIETTGAGTEAIGSVTEDGELILGPGARRGAFAADELERLALEHVEALRQARARLTGGAAPLHLDGRVVVIVDEGIVTGRTMTAAVRSAKNRGARKVIVAAPVASRTAVTNLEAEGAEVRVPLIPESVSSVAVYYQTFAPVDEQEVHACFVAD